MGSPDVISGCRNATPHEPKRWDERVRLRAYYLWVAAGRPLGHNDEFWDQAHREIIAEAASGDNKEHS